MRPFTKNETIGISIIILIIFGLTLYNLQISLRRARDSQRRSDIGAISDALDKYQKDFGFFPPSTPEGKILACKGDNFGEVPEDIPDSDKKKYFFSLLRGCQWGDDSFSDVNDVNYEAYLKFIPKDPNADNGLSYYYISNMNRFQLYAYLEGEIAEVGYRDGIVKRNLNCGNRVCNFGKAYGDTSLEKSIEEYENETKGDK